uniref:Secreted protein n=1 Tax=Mastacembelus armatus TaxID=205130 RepID=A0A3Q3MD46_9TELE
MRPRSIALTRHVRAASMASCLLGLSSALPITERISSNSLSISFLARSLSSELRFVWRHSLCRISSHWAKKQRAELRILKRF